MTNAPQGIVDRSWPRPTSVAVALLAAIGMLTAAGIAVISNPNSGPWDLDGELTVPAAFSAILLISTGVLAIAAGRMRIDEQPRVWRSFGVLVVVMALDEIFAVHEVAEARMAVDWQILYAPLIAACGVAWILVARALWQIRQAFFFMLLGAGCWLASQILEIAEWTSTDQRVTNYDLLMTIEESLEMIGSGCLLLAIYTALRRHSLGLAPPGVRSAGGRVDRRELG